MVGGLVAAVERTAAGILLHHHHHLLLAKRRGKSPIRMWKVKVVALRLLEADAQFGDARAATRLSSTAAATGLLLLLVVVVVVVQSHLLHLG